MSITIVNKSERKIYNNVDVIEIEKLNVNYLGPDYCLVGYIGSNKYTLYVGYKDDVENMFDKISICISKADNVHINI